MCLAQAESDPGCSKPAAGQICRSASASLSRSYSASRMVSRSGFLWTLPPNRAPPPPPPRVTLPHSPTINSSLTPAGLLFCLFWFFLVAELELKWDFSALRGEAAAFSSVQNLSPSPAPCFHSSSICSHLRRYYGEGLCRRGSPGKRHAVSFMT